MALRLLWLAPAAAVVVGGVLAWGYARLTAPGPLEVPTTVIVAPGAGLDDIVRLLARAGVVGDTFALRWGARLTGAHKRLRAGEYAFPAGVSPAQVLAIVESGKVVVRRLTVAEGLTSAQVASQLAAAEGLDGAIQVLPGEGTLLPETYHFSRGDGRADILRRMADGMIETLHRLWAGRASDLPLETPGAALILASIVEKETAVASERARIAAVFINRLRRGMRLQSDPTVAYGLTAGRGTLERALTHADLAAPSPYNTYLIDGLPPGPICNPGRAAIAAVMRPAVTDELYFVADGSGGHVFARSLAEHNRNVAKWRSLKKGGRTGGR